MFWTNIICVLLSISLLGQDKFVELKIEPQSVEIGHSFTVTVKTNVNGKITMNLPDEFVQSGPRQSGMSSSIKIVHGKRKAIRFSYQSFSGSIDKKGRYLFGPAKVISNRGKEYKSDSYTVKVIKPHNMISEDPSKNTDQLAFGIIQQSKKKIYEGQPIVIEGRVYSKVDVMQVNDYSPFSFSGPADSRNLDPSNRVTLNYEVVNGKKLQTFDIGKTLIFPEKVGKFEIQPFKTSIVYNDPRSLFPDQLKIVSNTTTVDVQPLPSGTPKNFIDAVGEFEVMANVDKTKISQGKVVELHVKIQGQGNLQNIKKPQINLPKNLSFYGDPEVRDTLSYSTLGAQGSKTFIYYIQVNRSGNIQLDPIEIAYFNPLEERYKTAKCAVKKIHVQSNGKSVQSKPTFVKEEVQEPTMRPYLAEKKDNGSGWTDFFDGVGGSIALLSPILLGVVFGFGFRIKNKNEENNRKKNQLLQQKRALLTSLDQLEIDQQGAYVMEVTQILMRFLTKQFNADVGEVTRAYLKEKVPHDLSEETYSKIITVFNELDTMKFAGSNNHEASVHLIDEVKQIINSFDQ